MIEGGEKENGMESSSQDSSEYSVKQEVYLPGLLREEEEESEEDIIEKEREKTMQIETQKKEENKKKEDNINIVGESQQLDQFPEKRKEQLKMERTTTTAATTATISKASSKSKKLNKSLSEYNFFSQVSRENIEFPCQRKLNEFCNFLINRVLLVSVCDGSVDKVLMKSKNSLQDCWPTTTAANENNENNKGEDTGKGEQEIVDNKKDISHAMDFLDAVAALSVCSSLSVDSTRAKIENIAPYNIVYSNVVEMLQNAHCDYQNVLDGKLVPQDKEICLSLMDSISENTRMTRTKILNQLSNRVLRTLVYGTNEDCEKLSDELKTNKEKYLNSCITQCPMDMESQQQGKTAKVEAETETETGKCPIDHKTLLAQGYSEEEIRTQMTAMMSSTSNNNHNPTTTTTSTTGITGVSSGSTSDTDASSSSTGNSQMSHFNLTPNPGESMYYDTLVAHTKSGMEARAPGLSGSYANAYQRLLTLIVQEIGTRSGPVNDDFYESFVSWESGLRKNITEPFWNPLPTELTGVWFLEEDYNMYKDGRIISSSSSSLEGETTISSGVGPRTRKQVANRLPTKEEILNKDAKAEDGQSLSLYAGVPVVFRKDGSMQVDPEIGLGGTWRLEPGPTHLDTIFFSIIPAGRPSSVLQYTGYIDRGQRIECRFSKRPIRMMGRVNYLVRGEVKNIARFSMRKDYLSRAFYPTQGSVSTDASSLASGDWFGKKGGGLEQEAEQNKEEKGEETEEEKVYQDDEGHDDGSNSSENRKKNHNVSSSNNNPVVSAVSLYSLDTLLSVKRISMNLNKEINKQMESFFGILDERIEAIAIGKR